MKKTENIGPFRISAQDQDLVDRAVTKSGVQLATKVRELLLKWARAVLK